MQITINDLYKHKSKQESALFVIRQQNPFHLISKSPCTLTNPTMKYIGLELFRKGKRYMP